MNHANAVDDRGKWSAIAPHCERDKTEFYISSIHFSLGEEIKLVVLCPSCSEVRELILSRVGHIFTTRPVREDEKEDKKWQLVPLHCENENCKEEYEESKLGIVEICVSADGDLLVESRCFACGGEEIQTRIFSRQERISAAFAAGEIITDSEPVEAEEQLLADEHADATETKPARPN